MAGRCLAAFIAGGIALFAPCCISVMLPAYFAGSFQNRRLLVAMTFLFMAAVATVILPIALGASFLRQLLTSHHTLIYVAGGVIMLALATAAPSFGLALGLGSAYVFGMVAPLFLISLSWEKYDWRASRLFRPRSFTWRLGGFRRTITAARLSTRCTCRLAGRSVSTVQSPRAKRESDGKEIVSKAHL